MASAWSNAKNAKIARNGAICEICGREGNIGHHIVPRSKGGTDCYNNLEIRCSSCEQWAHEQDPDGNPPERLIQQRSEYYALMGGR